jgi:hypothetical protein
VKRSIVDKARELGGLNATNQTLTEPEKVFQTEWNSLDLRG